MRLVDPDAQFFAQHPSRKAHIRMPKKVLARDAQRAMRYVDESEGEFWSLGEHVRERRRILLTRVDFHGNPLPGNRIMKIPFLAFADETIEDTDEVLLPLIKQIMEDALVRQERGR